MVPRKNGASEYTWPKSEALHRRPRKWESRNPRRQSQHTPTQVLQPEGPKYLTGQKR